MLGGGRGSLHGHLEHRSPLTVVCTHQRDRTLPPHTPSQVGYPQIVANNNHWTGLFSMWKAYVVKCISLLKSTYGALRRLAGGHKLLFQERGGCWNFASFLTESQTVFAFVKLYLLPCLCCRLDLPIPALFIYLSIYLSDVGPAHLILKSDSGLFTGESVKAI